METALGAGWERGQPAYGRAPPSGVSSTGFAVFRGATYAGA
ncbi:hypothetical protein BH11ACT7_BH11ACT7_11020 [soil metagenome]